MAKTVSKPAVPREWIRTPADREAVRQGYYFDLAAAERVRTFFRTFLTHSKGEFADQPFELLEWQWRDVIAPLFGWKRPDGSRRFRVGYIEIPKKNGKSCLGSGLCLYWLVGDQEAGAEVYTAAADKKQASIVFNESATMVEASVPLRARLEVIPSRKHIAYLKTHSTMEALSNDVKTKDGINAHGVMFDELHTQPNRKLWDVLRYAGAARRQPMIVAITTAGHDRTSICWEQHEYAEAVIKDQHRDLSFFGYIRAAGEKDDWTKPAAWYKANPSLGVTITEESFAADCREAQRSASKENAFKRLRLNIWTEQIVRWLKMDDWRKCQDNADPVTWRVEAMQRLAGQECTAGLDLGSTGDITAASLLFGKRATGYESLNFYWVPKEGCWRDNGTYRALYEQWARQGFLEFTDGNVTDYKVVRKRFNQLGDVFGIKEIAVDRSFQGAQLTTDLAEDGFEMVPFGQGFYSMGAPTKEYEELVLGHLITHGSNPVQSWMAANAAAKCDDHNNLKVVKPEKSSPLKVDGIITDIMAIGRIMATPAPKLSIYSRRAAEEKSVAQPNAAKPASPPAQYRPGRRMSIYSRRAAEEKARREQHKEPLQ